MKLDLSESDWKLLAELGLSECVSISACREKMETLGMRQLDRLKMMFQRLSSSTGVEVADGVRKNDLEAFASLIFGLIHEGKKQV